MPGAVYVFLDWCPKATNAVDPITFTLSEETKAKINEFIWFIHSDLAKSVSISECHYRNDGMLLFSLKLNQEIIEKSSIPYDTLVTLSATASNHVKQLIGHTHIFDTDHCGKRKMRFPSISKHPVMVTYFDNKDISEGNLQDIISDNSKLVKLLSINSKNKTRRSVLLIRERFSKVFDKSFIAISHVKKLSFGSAVDVYGVFIFVLFAISAVTSFVKIIRFDDPAFFMTGIINTLTAVLVMSLYNLMHVIHFFHFIYVGQFKIFVNGIVSAYSAVVHFIFSSEIRELAWRICQNTIGRRLAWRLVITTVLLMPFFLACDLVRPAFPLTQKIMGLFGQEPGYYSFDFAVNAFSYKQFANGWKDELLRIIWVLPIVIFTLEVSHKRRKIIKILSRARGIMSFGSIYNGVVQNILSHSSEKDEYSQINFQNFDHAISIIDDRLYIEKNKRIRSYIFCISLLLILLGLRFIEKPIF